MLEVCAYLLRGALFGLILPCLSFTRYAFHQASFTNKIFYFRYGSHSRGGGNLEVLIKYPGSESPFGRLPPQRGEGV